MRPSSKWYYGPVPLAFPDVLAPPLATGTSPQTFHLYTAQLSVSYTFDVWGLNRRTVESLKALADDQRFQVEAAYLTLTSNVVVAEGIGHLELLDAGVYPQILEWLREPRAAPDRPSEARSASPRRARKKSAS